METVFDYRHPSLGTVRGLTADSTNRFLGVQYANLHDRFSQPTLREGDRNGSLDATTFGYHAVQQCRYVVVKLTMCTVDQPYRHPQ